MTAALSAHPTKHNYQELMARVGNARLTDAERINSVGDVMRAAQHQMMAALPKHVTPDRMIRVAMNCLRKNPKLLKCTPVSLFASMTEAATYGWELGGVLGHAYLVPFRCKKGNEWVEECTLIPGYKGLVDLCRRSGQVSTIDLQVVHQGDVFKYSLGDEPHIHHIPNDNDPQRNSKPITHAYVVVKLRDGGTQRSVWSTAMIEAHKEQYSKAWDWAENGIKDKGGGKRDSSWHTAWPTMAKKTVLREMINRGLVPMSAEYANVVDRAGQVDDEIPVTAGIDFLPTREEESDFDNRTIVDQSQEPAGDESDPLDALLAGLHDSQDRAAFYTKAINSTLDKELLNRLKGVIEGDETIDIAERDLLAKKIEKRVK